MKTALPLSMTECVRAVSADGLQQARAIEASRPD